MSLNKIPSHLRIYHEVRIPRRVATPSNIIAPARNSGAPDHYHLSVRATLRAPLIIIINSNNHSENVIITN